MTPNYQFLSVPPARPKPAAAPLTSFDTLVQPLPPPPEPKATYAQIERALAPLLVRTIPRPCASHADLRQWFLVDGPAGPAAFRRWVVAFHAVLDRFDLSDVPGRSWARKPEAWWGGGAERRSLELAVGELDAHLRPLADELHDAWRREALARQVHGRWGEPTPAALATALARVDWAAVDHRDPIARAWLAEAEAVFQLVEAACGGETAEAAWNANTPNRFNR